MPREHRGAAFGGGYACSVAVTWAFSFFQGGNPLGSTESVVVCAALSLVAIGLVAASSNVVPARADASLSDADGVGTSAARGPVAGLRASASAAGGPATRSPATDVDAPDAGASTANALAASADSPSRGATISADLLSLACLTVVLLSLVKNVGFGFPSADLLEGVSLESSRLFYAVGLLAAGLIADSSRKYAALCCIAALVIPFGFLALANEPVSGTILWAADYLFYGFFSVYRAVLFCDIAADAGCEHLAGFGLLFGRIGDALGTALWLALETNAVALVAVAAVLFAATVFAFYHLFLRLYPVRPAPRKTEEELFAHFSAVYGISMREREVLRLVLAGRTNAEIASELFITEGTVKYNVHNLFKKTGCSNRRDLLAKYSSET